MKILLTGHKGQLGTALQQTLTHHKLIGFDLPEEDITNQQSVKTAVSTHKPHLIIHSAAMTNVDGCAENPELAYKINGLGTQNIALAAQETGCELLHISTNEVFGGTRPEGYEEWMPLDPVNAYGRSKAAAEIHVRNHLSRFYIVRFSWLFAPGGHNFIHAILNRAHQTGEISVVTDEIANPTYVTDLAQAIAKLIETHQYGIYHLGNSGACSRWEFANEILKQNHLTHVTNNRILLKDYPRASTPPPATPLNNIAAKALGIQQRPWQEALADYIKYHV
ncbi:MAG: dTDP-4-dehydrorhamnose reductase [Chloroflexi bacterium]|nr:MAG: dTDP-4-dehydrorhamnose reductase [Chloroflexota bacterium]